MTKAASIRFSRSAHGRPGNFTVPRRVLHQLEIGQDEPIHLVVDGDSFHWEGTVTLASGEQVYAHADEPQTHALRDIRPHQRLTIVASRPPAER